jgi:succinate dehydrogenase/fumarate reductase iron-sulfur protein
VSFTLRIRRRSPLEALPTEEVEFRVPREDKMTVLDAISWVQRHRLPDLTYRYSCRVGMCGTCGVVINGREGWACRTLMADLGSDVVTVEPLRNLPVVKDLAVDMSPFFSAMTNAMAFFVPPAEQQVNGPSTLVNRMKERRAIDPHIECITCGICYSACTMVHWDSQYLGPAALNRAATLVMDSRDAGREQRLNAINDEHGCWRCHSQFTCTEVCPMNLRPTESIG